MPKEVDSKIYICKILLEESFKLYHTVFHIRRGNRDNLGIISHISHKSIVCDPSLELSYRDGSNEGSQHMFSLQNKENYL